MPSYKYLQLPFEACIRTLRLLPGLREDPIRVRIFYADLDLNTDYEALSYVWGDPDKKMEIICDGSPMQVTANLYEALHHFRYTDKHRTLWADAICINQADGKEKSTQVRMMGRIYWRATAVLVWLGLDNAHISDEEGNISHVPALETFDVIRERAKSLEVELALPGGWDNVDVISLKDIPKYNARRWLSVICLLQRPWFSRGWIIQELGLANDAARLVCGHAELEFGYYLSFITWIVGNGQVLLNYHNLTLRTQWLILDFWHTSRLPIQTSQPKARREFVRVLADARWAGFSNPRDHVYGMLGHPSAFDTRYELNDRHTFQGFQEQPSKNRETIVTPDYDKSLAEVYLETATGLMLHGIEGIDVLSYAINDSEEISDFDFPSWVPRWNKGHVQLRIKDNFSFYAATPRSKDPPLRISANCLQLRGINIGAIKWTYNITGEMAEGLYPNVQRGSPSSQFKDWLEILWKAYEAAHQSIIQEEDPDPCVFLFTLTAGYMNGYSAEDYRDEFEANAYAFQYTKAVRLKKDFSYEELGFLKTHAIGGDASQFLRDLQICEQRALFLSHDGQSGLAPPASVPGDEVWIFEGARTPFVVRKLGDVRRLVGEAYVHGAMRGKAFKQDRLEDIELQ
ncbi:HET-domain-containing protein [Amniculicola lignicola CBS 123094]|uniref:HET-domain-containing protein n=1 Tax=Amniculicola lignicola CBS 123094 TaxID=1392246 RepID=A0A6A5WA43_9PLEO|nr:HET-domain-containing protein [Amniculicola lignicola CBS 123094]